jgi:hypothetical protein
MPAHPRDLEQMMYATQAHWANFLERPLVLASLNPGKATSEKKLKFRAIAPSARFRFYWKPLASNRVDGLTLRQISSVVRKLRRDFDRIDRIVISDFFFVRSEFVRQLQAVYSAPVVFVPEGVGALRLTPEEEPLRFLGWLASARALLGDVKDNIWHNPRGRPRTISILEIVTALARVAVLTMLRPAAPVNTRLDFIETLVMPVGRSSESPIKHLRLREFSFGTKGNSPDPRIGVFVHQPFALEPKVWERMVRTAKTLGVERIILKQHQVADGWFDLVEAAGRVFEKTQIECVCEGLVEQLVDARSAGLVFGITSTALGNIAAQPGVSRRVISFVGLVESASEGSKSNGEHLQHQADWLKNFYGAKIEFL